MTVRCTALRLLRPSRSLRYPLIIGSCWTDHIGLLSFPSMALSMRKSVSFINRLVSSRIQSLGALKQRHLVSSRRIHQPEFPDSPKIPTLANPAALFSSRRFESTEAEKLADCVVEIGDGNQVFCNSPVRASASSSSSCVCVLLGTDYHCSLWIMGIV